MDYINMDYKNMDYKEKLKKAKELYPTANADQRYVLECLFPELKEGEDERIRKKLIDLIYKVYANTNYITCVEHEQILAWLEKQGEQKSIWHNEDEEPQRGRLILLIMQSGTPVVAKIIEPNHTFNHGERWAYIDDLLEKQSKTFTKKDIDDAYLKGVCDAKSELEKQGNKETLCDKCRKEQPSHSCQDITANGRCYIEGINTSNNIKPKFKVGDWVIDKQGIVHQIANVIEIVTCHTYGYDVVGGGYFNEEGVRLWTIQDAKDGDVLACGDTKNVILIFRGIGNTEWDHVIDYHCYYDCYSEAIIVQKDLSHWGDIKDNGLYPATKEQRDLLFQKMKDAGYEWDADKKEVRKYESKN